MKQLLPFLIFPFLYGCISYDRKQEVFKTDTDFTEFWRLPSPDSSTLLLSYGLDLGAIGYGRAGTAVLKLNDTTHDLRQFTLPYNLDRFTWLDKSTVSARFDIMPSVRSGEPSNLKDTVVNGITIKVSSYDYIEPNAKQIIEHRELSPNGLYELIAYRYIIDRGNLNFIHVSIIAAGEQIPKYGNYFIADMESDYALYGTWDKDNTLIFYSNDLYKDMVAYFIVHDHPDIKYKVINDNKTYSSKYRWTAESSK
jgi:hypothetical protein